MYDNILLPVAPGGKTDDAVPHAASLADRYDATVHVVSAVDTTVESIAGPRSGAFAERIEEAAEERVERVTADLEAAGVSAVGSVVHGDPLEVIENAIDSTGADMVVMPSNTRSGIRRLLLGSVTEKVVRVSPVPVVTIPLDGRGADAESAESAAETDESAAETDERQ